MQNNHIYIKEEVFSVENTSSLSLNPTQVFALIRENQGENIFFISENGTYKCLVIETHYKPQAYGVLHHISGLFSRYGVSIFALTSIDYGYFFFEEKLQKIVEEDIIPAVINYLQ